MKPNISKATRRKILPIIAAVLLLVLAFTESTAAQTGPAAAQARPKTAGENFKNVTTSALRDPTVDDFMRTMGVMAAAVGFDCADCHRTAGCVATTWADDTGISMTVGTIETQR